MNRVFLIGNVATEIEMRTTQGGVSCASFRIAVRRDFKNSHGEYDSDFISVKAWRNTADFIRKYFGKGSRIVVMGTIQTRTYDAQDGTKRYVTEVIADKVEFGGGNRENANGSAGSDAQDGFTPVDDDDLPF